MLLYLFIPFSIISWNLPAPQDIQWLILPLVMVGLWAWLLFYRKCPIEISSSSFWIFCIGMWGAVHVESQRDWTSYQQLIHLSLLTLPLLWQRTSWRFSHWVILSLFGFFWNTAYLVSLVHPFGFYLFSPFNQENHYQFCNLLWLFLLWDGATSLHLSLKKRRYLVSLLFLSVLSLVTLGCTGSKNVQLGLLLGLFLAALLWLLRGSLLRSLNQKMLWLGAILLLTFAFVVFPFLSLHWTWFMNLGDSFSARGSIWYATYRMIQEHWLVGVGSGSYTAYIQGFWPTISEAPFLAMVYPSVAHNYVLHFWSQHGLVGLLLAVGWIAWIWVRTVSKFCVAQDVRSLFAVVLSTALLPILALSEVTQLLPSAILAFYLIGLHLSSNQKSAPWYTCSRRLSWVVGCAVCLGVGISAYGVVQEMRAQSLVRDVFLKGTVESSDVPNVRRSCELHDNSLAEYYASILMIHTGLYDDAEKALARATVLGGYRLAYDRRRAQIWLGRGDCSKALEMSRKVLRYRSMESEPWLRDIALSCSDLSNKSTKSP